MKTLILAFAFLGFAHFAHTTGGMIGGGDVHFKALMTCDASGIDSTFSNIAQIKIVKEIDYDGKFIDGATMRIVSLDNSSQAIRYYVTHESDLAFSPDGDLNLPIFKYIDGKQIGLFNWKNQLNAGTVAPVSSSNEVEEIQLSNCVLPNPEA